MTHVYNKHESSVLEGQFVIGATWSECTRGERVTCALTIVTHTQIPRSSLVRVFQWNFFLLRHRVSIPLTCLSRDAMTLFFPPAIFSSPRSLQIFASSVNQFCNKWNNVQFTAKVVSLSEWLAHLSLILLHWVKESAYKMNLSVVKEKQMNWTEGERENGEDEI